MDILYYICNLFGGAALVLIGLLPFVIVMLALWLIWLGLYRPEECSYNPSVKYTQLSRDMEVFNKNRKWWNPYTLTRRHAGFATFLFILFLIVFVWGFSLSVVLTDYQIKSSSKSGAPLRMGINKVTLSYSEYIKKENEIDDSKIKINESTELLRVKIVKIDPPKHMYVDLQTESGHIYTSRYVAKHCGNLPKLGDWYTVQVTYYAYKNKPEDRKIQFDNLYNELCGA